MSKKRLDKKSITPVVATALLLVVAVLAVVGFGRWFSTYQSGVNSNVERTSYTGSDLEVKGLINNILYLKSGEAQNLTELKVIDGNGNIKCDFSGSTQVNSSGLVGWWTFDNIINNSGTLEIPDLSGNGNFGVLNDSNQSNSDGWTPPKLVKTRLGHGLKFDGIDDYVEIPTNDFDLYNNFTVYVDGTLDYSNGTLLRIRSYGYELCIIDNKLIISAFYPNSSSTDYAENNFSKNNINEITYIFGINTTTYFSYYNNNYKFDLISQGGYYSPDGSGLTFGKDGDAVEHKSFFKGQIDEIRIYNRTLSDQEIKRLYWYSIRPQEKGINQIDLSSCNLNKGQIYNIVAFTKENKAEYSVIDR